MTQAVVVIGAGGFGRETLDVVEAVNRSNERPVFDVVGVVDDDPNPRSRERLAARGIEWIGGINEWIAKGSPAQYIIGIGNPLVRAIVDARLSLAGRSPASVIHPNASIGTMGVIGPGTVICSGAEISTNVSLGRHVHINPNVTVGHDAILADYVSINPAAVISGEVEVGSETLVGAAAVVMQGLFVGSRCVIGASACVTRDVADSMTVKGVPAR